MTSSLNMIRGRSNIVTLTNNSGGALIAGDVCVQDTSADERATTTTSAASVLKVFVAAESIASGAAGRFYESGYCPLVNVSASVTRGRFLFTHTVAKQAAESATYGTGAFGKILKSGTTPSAIIYSATAQSSGAGVTRSGSTTDNHLAVWDGSNADSIKDGGATSALAANRATRTAGDLTTTSTSMVDATGLTVTIITGAHRCLVSFVAMAKMNATDTAIFDLAIDGSLIGGTYGTTLAQSASGTVNVGFTYLTDALTAASHTFKIQWKSVGGQQATLYASSSVTPAIISVVELNA